MIECDWESMSFVIACDCDCGPLRPTAAEGSKLPAPVAAVVPVRPLNQAEKKPSDDMSSDTGDPDSFSPLAVMPLEETQPTPQTNEPLLALNIHSFIRHF